MPDRRDQLDIQGLRLPPAGGVPSPTGGFPTASSGELNASVGPESSPGPARRAALNIFFRCSNTYTKAFRNQAGDAYLAICPKCGMTKRFIVGEGGTAQRTFTLTCQ